MSLRVNVDVPELEPAITFYTQVFGLRVGRRLGTGWAELLGTDCPIDLLAKPAGSAPFPGAPAGRDYGRHWTPVHLDFVVDELEPAVARAVASGARLKGDVLSRPFGKLAVLSDPWGNGFCFLQLQGRGYDELPGIRHEDPGQP